MDLVSRDDFEISQEIEVVKLIKRYLARRSRAGVPDLPVPEDLSHLTEEEKKKREEEKKKKGEEEKKKSDEEAK